MDTGLKRGSFETLLGEGIAAFENGQHENALLLFKKTIVADFKRPEGWFWKGRVYEDLGQDRHAAQSFFMSCDMRPGFGPARHALRRLGYLEDSEPKAVIQLKAARKEQGFFSRFFKRDSRHEL
jgi:hypothetical protein